MRDFVPEKWIAWLLAGIGLLAWLWTNLSPPLTAGKRESLPNVVLSVPTQLVFSGGDRYLAANIDVWRAMLVNSQDLHGETLQAVSRLHLDVSWLHPGHEDNYYMASAVLPWEGYVDEGMLILRRAAAVRSSDVLPSFLAAFYELNMRGDVNAAVLELEAAAAHADERGVRDYFLEMAARWHSHGEDPEFSKKVLTKLAGSTRNMKLKKFLDNQIARLDGLAVLQSAVLRFRSLYHRLPTSLAQLVDMRVIASLPTDPAGLGYGLKNGWPFLVTASRVESR